VNPNLPLANVRTLREVYDRSLARTSFALVMLAIAGRHGAAPRDRGDLRRDFVLGVAAHAGDRHPQSAGRSEPGSHAHVRAVRRAPRGTRILCGIVVSAAIMRLMSSLLFDVSPMDPLTYAGVSAGLAAAAVCSRAMCPRCARRRWIRWRRSGRSEAGAGRWVLGVGSYCGDDLLNNLSSEGKADAARGDRRSGISRR